jgi:hypothetical protein
MSTEPTTTYSEGDSFNLNYTSRFYRYVKASAITGVSPAIVELITNADDAYRRSSLEPLYPIAVELSYKDRTVVVYDHATGLSFERMIECFGQVGTYTSSKDARGYFSRGAKDITAIGNVYFTSIHNGTISQIKLSTDDILTVIQKEVIVTSEDREMYHIPVNGLHVKIDLKLSVQLPGIEELNKMSNYYSMRGLFSDPNNDIQITVFEPNEGIPVYNSKIKYTYPEIEKLLTEEEFTVDGYDGVVATFRLQLLEEPSETDIDTNHMEYGILISSGNAIHEVSTLSGDIRYHPMMSSLTGTLTCSYINDLMYDFDQNGESLANPFPIIDHSRTYGLNKKHPFVKALFKRPLSIIRFILQDLYENRINDSTMSSDITDLFSDLKLFGENILMDLIDEVYPYRKIDKFGQYDIIKKQNERVVSSNKSAEYDFQEMNLKDIEERKGTLVGKSPNFNIRFVDDIQLTTMYRIYRMNNTIHLEINSKDFLVSKYILKKDDDTYSITHTTEMGMLLISLVTEALSRQILIEREVNTSIDSSVHSTFKDMDKFKNILVQKLYEIIVLKNMLGKLIENDDIQ